MIRFFYTVLLLLISPFFLWGLYKKKKGKPSVGKRWKEHFGYTRAVRGSKPVWIHAVSVGEILAISPFIKELKKQHPNLSIVLTTTTATGAEQAQKLADIAEHRYMPLDFPWAISRFIKIVHPSQLIIMETELWPNTLAVASHYQLPVSVVNARLSQRSCDRYAKVRYLFNTLFARNISRIYCQHDDDARRFIYLGVPEDKVVVTGSMKFDITVPDEAKQKGRELRERLGKDRPVWIAASTHKGEDEHVLAAHKAIVEAIPNATLIIVPRHPERFDTVAKLIEGQQWHFARRTESADTDISSVQVYLADSMGEMFTLLAASDVCFMGGSLLGDKVGGHNLLEPAAIGIPSIIGPSYYNFKDITEQLSKNNAAQIISSLGKLESAVCNLLAHSGLAKDMGITAQHAVNESRGANQRTLELIF